MPFRVDFEEYQRMRSKKQRGETWEEIGRELSLDAEEAERVYDKLQSAEDMYRRLFRPDKFQPVYLSDPNAFKLRDYGRLLQRTVPLGERESDVFHEWQYELQHWLEQLTLHYLKDPDCKDLIEEIDEDNWNKKVAKELAQKEKKNTAEEEEKRKQAEEEEKAKAAEREAARRAAKKEEIKTKKKMRYRQLRKEREQREQQERQKREEAERRRLAGEEDPEPPRRRGVSGIYICIAPTPPKPDWSRRVRLKKKW